MNTAALASKLIKQSVGSVTNHQHDDGLESDTADAAGQHGISDAALETTIATLHRLSGLTDSSTGKLAIKDKRYRSLRKCLYELQHGAGLHQTSALSSIGSGNGNNHNGVASLFNPESTNASMTISTSKITHEISEQIENGAYEMAITTLQNVRKLQEEHAATQQANKSGTSNCIESDKYLRPKLGAVQRWVRQVDAAGTDDPLALGVLDAILRVVAPEAICDVDKADLEKATWAKLGVHTITSLHENGTEVNGGSVRLFPVFDRRQKGDVCEKRDCPAYEPDVFGSLVNCMQVGEDGIRRVDGYNDNQRMIAFRRCGFEKGEERKPPNKYDLELQTTTAADPNAPERATWSSHFDRNTVSGKHVLLQSSGATIVKSSLPYVQDSFLLENVLSPMECDRLLAAAETAGYHPDEPLAGQPGASILAHACVWIVDDKLERTIFDRVKQFLPTYQYQQNKQGTTEVATLHPLGINRRFRFYRYVPGRYYRPHIDGAWPPSGFDSKGNYRYDICDDRNKNGLQFVDSAVDTNEAEDSEKDKQNVKQAEHEHVTEAPTDNNSRRQMSRLTFLIYLNDDFEGGHTTFLLPAKDKEGTLNAFPVNPVRGGILVFPHGTCAAPLHEGSPVLKRCKYVVRTEVEYYV